MAYENEKQQNIKKEKIPTRMGFEPTRAEPNGLAVHRLNHSATSSWEYAADRQNNRNKIAVTCPRHFPIILAIAAS